MVKIQILIYRTRDIWKEIGETRHVSTVGQEVFCLRRVIVGGGQTLKVPNLFLGFNTSPRSLEMDTI